MRYAALPLLNATIAYIMDFQDYQTKSRTTALYPEAGNNWIYPTLGLVAEAGEAANKLKKAIRDDAGILTDTRKEEIKDELGDVLWYIAQVATELHLELSEIAQANLDKLQSRLERGVIGGSGDKR